MEDFRNKIAVVTGGSSGIGYAAAKELSRRGAGLIITGRQQGTIEKAAAEIGAIPFVADQSRLEDTDLLREAIADRFGKIDILFINAGITGAADLIESAVEENFDNVMDINFKGAYFTLSRLIPLLNDGASVVFLSSIVASTYRPGSSIYQASKAALNSIAKTAAAELAPRKIRVNTVSPGPTRTDVLRKSYDAATAEGIWDNLATTIPLKKIGKPEEVAQMVAYLCSDMASFVTGSDFVIDGGITL